MAIPTLVLVVEKGPRKGETIECKQPCDRVRIGRVLKGNNFTIKDSSISQKHLTVEYDQGFSSWVVTDLDTSNGTILNGNAIDPLFPTALSDGGIIKFGEDTSISVHINIPVDTNVAEKEEEEEKAAEEEVKVTRRYATRGGAKNKTKLEEKIEELKKKEKNVAGTGRQRGRPKKVLETEPSAASVLPEVVKLKLRDGEDVMVVKGEGRIEEPINNVSLAGGTSNNGNLSKGDETMEAEGSEARGPEEDEVDLEKITLAEWFDSAEKYLPMMIQDAADEIIADLRERARLYNQFLNEKFNAAGKKS